MRCQRLPCPILQLSRARSSFPERPIVDISVGQLDERSDLFEEVAIVADAGVDLLGLDWAAISHSVETAPVDLGCKVTRTQAVRSIAKHFDHRLMQSLPAALFRVFRLQLHESEESLKMRHSALKFGDLRSMVCQVVPGVIKVGDDLIQMS
jgi:hypothetical protein